MVCSHHQFLGNRRITNFFAKIHSFYWEEPFLFKYCADQIIRRCVPEEEQQGILSHYDESACGGNFASQKTAMKVLKSRLYWPFSLEGCPQRMPCMQQMPKTREDLSPSHDAPKPNFSS